MKNSAYWEGERFGWGVGEEKTAHRRNEDACLLVCRQVLEMVFGDVTLVFSQQGGAAGCFLRSERT